MAINYFVFYFHLIEFEFEFVFALLKRKLLTIYCLGNPLEVANHSMNITKVELKFLKCVTKEVFKLNKTTIY